MKTTLLLTLFLTLTYSLWSQDITGKWNGILTVQGTQLTIVFNISKSEEGYTSTMDSPDQGAKGIATTYTKFRDSLLQISIENMGLEYEGMLQKNGKFEGAFKQMGRSFDLNLSREKAEKKRIVRPQEPQLPYPYNSEEITFENKEAGIQLAGTLTFPKGEGTFPAVVLISGSGPQNRDEELLGHKPFLILSDYFTKNGIAVLRFDERGVGNSTGNFGTATTYDLADDVEKAIEYLQSRKEVHQDKIGLIGHSEGGVIAPMIASRNKNVDFIVLLAGPAMPGNELMLMQKYKIEKQMGMNDLMLENNQRIFRGAYDLVLNKKFSSNELKDTLSGYFKSTYGALLSETDLQNTIKQISSPWLVEFIRMNPEDYLSKVKCPILALNGEKDLQVPPKENLEIIKTKSKKSKSVTVKELANMNHLFQECETGAACEYGQIEQTFSPIALKEILDWIEKESFVK